MSSETASEAIRLPTVAEIDAATGLISLPEKYTKVFRVNDSFAVKVGYHVPLSPKVLAAFTDPGTNKTYIIMELLPGDTLEALLPSLNPDEKATISKLIKTAITGLRSIPPPDYFGMLNRQPFLDGVIYVPGLSPKICGPFSNEEDLNAGLLEKLQKTESEHYIRFLQNMVNQTLKGHRPVFTHDRNGCPDFKITLLDWESAGWYPEFWDFCNSTVACRFKPDWLELVPNILDQYPVEYLTTQVIYALMYF
ncbi:kinase-like protein [Aspergillus californicus]